MIAIPKAPEGIGKATAMIAQDALRVGLPVVQVEWLAEGGIGVESVVAVDEEDTENYFAGWRLVTRPIT